MIAAIRRTFPRARRAVIDSPDAVVRTVLVAALVASYLLTWDLWRERTYPPNLPALDVLGSAGPAIALVIAAAASLRFPKTGSTVHGLLLVAAFLADQARLQPEFVSLGLLLSASAWPPFGPHIARWHLITLWGWAGIHKVLSEGWPTGGAGFIADAISAPGLRSIVAVVVPLTEIGLALLALRRRTWKVLRWSAPAFHLGVVLALALVNWNTAVWPWNLSLAVLAPLLFLTTAQDPRTRREGAGAVASAAILAVYPLGFYFGMVDAYVAHNLYSYNGAEASICSSDPASVCRPAPFDTLRAFNVPLPPEPRLYEAWFDLICLPGETLRVAGINTRVSIRTVRGHACARSDPA